MRDDDGRPPLRELPEAREDRVLGLGVERRGRLVEHEDVRLLAHERARQRDLLPLPARQLRPVLEPPPERRIEPARQRRHHLRRPAALDRALDARLVLQVLDAPHPDVLAHLELVLVEVLEEHAEALPQRLRVPLAQVPPVEQDAPLGRLVEARQELHERRLPGAVLARRAPGSPPPGSSRLTCRSAHASLPGYRKPTSSSTMPAPRRAAPRPRLRLRPRRVRAARARARRACAMRAGTPTGSTCRGCARTCPRSPPSADWNACCPCRNATTYSVMFPSVSAPAAASSAIAAYAAVERPRPDERQELRPLRAPHVELAVLLVELLAELLVALEQHRPDAEELHLLRVLVVREHVLEVEQPPRLGRAPVSDPEGELREAHLGDRRGDRRDAERERRPSR